MSESATTTAISPAKDENQKDTPSKRTPSKRKTHAERIQEESKELLKNMGIEEMSDTRSTRRSTRSASKAQTPAPVTPPSAKKQPSTPSSSRRGRKKKAEEEEAVEAEVAVNDVAANVSPTQTPPRKRQKLSETNAEAEDKKQEETKIADETDASAQESNGSVEKMEVDAEPAVKQAQPKMVLESELEVVEEPDEVLPNQDPEPALLTEDQQPDVEVSETASIAEPSPVVEVKELGGPTEVSETSCFKLQAAVPQLDLSAESATTFSVTQEQSHTVETIPEEFRHVETEAEAVAAVVAASERVGEEAMEVDSSSQAGEPAPPVLVENPPEIIINEPEPEVESTGAQESVESEITSTSEKVEERAPTPPVEVPESVQETSAKSAGILVETAAAEPTQVNKISSENLPQSEEVDTPASFKEPITLPVESEAKAIEMTVEDEPISAPIETQAQ